MYTIVRQGESSPIASFGNLEGLNRHLQALANHWATQTTVNNYDHSSTLEVYREGKKILEFSVKFFA